ncbi:hypothetical protein C2E23DRAFT_358164 [Lenzites betulinus]|nr:hypothetical protein C2E23DRAFT_358164 [Lenzites betulinus]
MNEIQSLSHNCAHEGSMNAPGMDQRAPPPHRCIPHATRVGIPKPQRDPAPQTSVQSQEPSADGAPRRRTRNLKNCSLNLQTPARTHSRPTEAGDWATRGASAVHPTPIGAEGRARPRLARACAFAIPRPVRCIAQPRVMYGAGSLRLGLGWRASADRSHRPLRDAGIGGKGEDGCRGAAVRGSSFAAWRIRGFCNIPCAWPSTRASGSRRSVRASRRFDRARRAIWCSLGGKLQV